MKINQPQLSGRQEAILAFIKEEINCKGYPPTVREIGKKLGFASTASVHAQLLALEKKGYIRRDPAKQRALEVLFQDHTPSSSSSSASSFSFMLPGQEINREMAMVPVVGTITAGVPILAEENVEDIFPVPVDFLHTKKDTFILKVSGESMIEAGILDGDYIILEQTPVVENGEIAAVLIDDSATVKYFYLEKDHIRLQPANSAMEPIIVQEAQILGRVIGLFRRF